MNRISNLVLALALGGAGVGLVSPSARASDVHVGVSFGIPLPNGAIGITVGNAPYYYHHGSYYRPHRHGHGYYPVPPPYGACVPWLPSSYVGVAINGATYFHNGAIYYQYTPGGYRVCPPPVAVAAPAPAPAVTTPAPEPAPVPSVFLPKSTDMAGTIRLRLHGTTYFYKSGMFFRKTSSGYVSTAAPIGAVAQHLPGDAEAMMLGQQEYFASGDAVFKQVRDGFMLLDG